ncbi:hemoblobin-interacting domain-containing protein [Brevibacillus reuszeri]|uniref:hemoblobin-interacting domain-containing protein n=1 Tax=Brevibacillus reuszeri TaxID=54915 RepID=UPI00406A9B0D
MVDTRISFEDPEYYDKITSVKLYSVVGNVKNELKILHEEWPGGYDYYDPGVGMEKILAFSPNLFPQSKIYQVVIKSDGYVDVVLTIEGPVPG